MAWPDRSLMWINSREPTIPRTEPVQIAYIRWGVGEKLSVWSYFSAALTFALKVHDSFLVERGSHNRWDRTVYDAMAKISLDDRRLIALLEHPIALVDQIGCIVDCNKVFQEYLGRDAPCVLGQAIVAILDEADQHGFARYLQHVTQADDAARAGFKARIDLNGVPYLMSLEPLQSDDRRAALLCQLVRLPTSDEVRLEYLMEHLDQGVWDYDVATATFAVSQAWRTMRGFANDLDINEPKRVWLDDVHPEDRATLQEVFDGQTQNAVTSIHIQYRHKHADGHWVWILCRAKVVEVDPDGGPLRIVGTDTDVTTLRRRDSDLLGLTNKLKLAIDAAGIGVWEYDPVTNAVHWNDRMLQIYGLTDGKNIRRGELWETYLHPDDLEGALAYSDHCQRHELDFRRDYRIVRPDGGVRYVRSLADYVAAPSMHGKLVGVNIDVTDDYHRTEQLEQARAQLEYDSRHDVLTGLANRRLLDERTDALCKGASPVCDYAVLHLDLDYFKQINDTLGHAAGDAVLVHVAQMLREIVGDEGLVCRSGGDEFVALFEKAPARDSLKQLCKTIIGAFEKPFLYEGHHCAFGVSIGCAFGQGAPAERSEIFVHADAALYAAKQAGRSCYRVYSEGQMATVRPQVHARHVLSDALRGGEIICHYQPQIDARTAKIVGAEALVRWQCPDRGLLAPNMFMPQADALGLVERIDAGVFEQVIAQQSRWFAQGVEFPAISMNVSIDRFEAETMLDHVQNLLQPHHTIAFELLETAFLDDLSADQLARLNALRALHIGLDLDDFGSGHSSVAAMQAVRPDRIKIDQRLVGPIADRPDQLKTLQLLSQLARLEGMGVVAEGLDTQAHLTAIAQVDCDVLQGYALHRPMPVDAFEVLLRG